MTWQPTGPIACDCQLGNLNRAAQGLTRENVVSCCTKPRWLIIACFAAPPIDDQRPGRMTSRNFITAMKRILGYCVTGSLQPVWFAHRLWIHLLAVTSARGSRS